MFESKPPKNVVVERTSYRWKRHQRKTHIRLVGVVDAIDGYLPLGQKPREHLTFVEEVGSVEFELSSQHQSQLLHLVLELHVGGFFLHGHEQLCCFRMLTLVKQCKHDVQLGLGDFDFVVLFLNCRAVIIGDRFHHEECLSVVLDGLGRIAGLSAVASEHQQIRLLKVTDANARTDCTFEQFVNLSLNIWKVYIALEDC